MRMSFDDKESFKEAVESHLRFDNARQQIGSSNGMALEVRVEDSESERNKGDIIPNDPITLRRVGSASSLSIQETRRSGIVFNNPPNNPEWNVEEVYGGPRSSQGRCKDAEGY